MSTVVEKQCLGCRKPLPLSAFGRNSGRADGLAVRCRPCAQQQKQDALLRRTAAPKPTEPYEPGPDWKWQDWAACAGESLDVFYEPGPECGPGSKEAREARAKALCRGCRVRTDCLEYALQLGDRWGVWGGLTPDERASERRRRQRRAAA